MLVPEPRGKGIGDQAHIGHIVDVAVHVCIHGANLMPVCQFHFLQHHLAPPEGLRHHRGQQFNVLGEGRGIETAHSVVGHVDWAQLLAAADQGRPVQSLHLAVQMDRQGGKLHRERPEAHLFHPARDAVIAQLASNHGPDHAMALAHAHSITAVLIYQLL